MFHEIINTITPFFYEHRYIFAFVGALFEGNTIMLLCGFLYKLGIFKFWNILFILALGYIINGYGWYAIGRFGGRKILEKWGPHFFLSQERINKLEDYFARHTNKALIITRATYGISSCVFILAGIFKTKWKQFFWCNFIGGIIWVFLMFGIGYSFGASYEALSKIVKVIAAWLVVVLFIVIFLVCVGIISWLRRKAKTKFIDKALNQNGLEKLKLISKKIIDFLTK